MVVEELATAFLHHETLGWMHLVDGNWRRDRLTSIFPAAMRLAECAVSETGQRAKVLTQQFVTSSLNIAKTMNDMATTSDQWDQDTFLLGTPTGTVDLRSGQHRPADGDDLISKQVAVAPAETEDAPQFKAFLNFAFNGNSETIAFLQRFLGYCLTGDMREQKLLYVYGPGGNGKGVLMRLVLMILGEYGRIAPESTLIQRGNTHPTDVAFLEGLRLAFVTETAQGGRFREVTINSITGADPMTARKMNKDFVMFTPECKLMVSGNNIPNLGSVNEAARRRFMILPMTRVPETPDAGLEAKLRKELPGILRWMINGCLAWQAHGLGSCPAIESATSGYFEQQDLVGRWIEAKATLDADASTPVADLYESWRSFLAEVGEEHESLRAFGSRLTAAGFASRSTTKDKKSVRVRVGIALQ
ncbi:MAG: hypothetical protein JXQ89_18370 [Pelagimonas sp.]